MNVPDWLASLVIVAGAVDPLWKLGLAAAAVITGVVQVMRKTRKIKVSITAEVTRTDETQKTKTRRKK